MCMIDTEAMTAAVELANRYIHDRKNPDKSIDLIDAACARERVKDLGNVTITRALIEEQLARVTGVPKTNCKTNVQPRLWNWKATSSRNCMDRMPQLIQY
jgi:ATP-dependent Clp protease ATP-binding subunit ClpA